MGNAIQTPTVLPVEGKVGKCKNFGNINEKFAKGTIREKIIAFSSKIYQKVYREEIARKANQKRYLEQAARCRKSAEGYEQRKKENKIFLEEFHAEMDIIRQESAQMWARIELGHKIRKYRMLIFERNSHLFFLKHEPDDTERLNRLEAVEVRIEEGRETFEACCKKYLTEYGDEYMP